MIASPTKKRPLCSTTALTTACVLGACGAAAFVLHSRQQVPLIGSSWLRAGVVGLLVLATACSAVLGLGFKFGSRRSEKKDDAPLTSCWNSQPSAIEIARMYRRETAAPPWVLRVVFSAGAALSLAIGLLLVEAAEQQHHRVVAWILGICIILAILLHLTTASSVLELAGDLRPPPDWKQASIRAMAHMDHLIETGEAPMIDLFVPCCKEELDVIQDTVIAALHQDYPTDRYIVHILDDGGDNKLREWIESLLEYELGRITYIRRRKIPGVPHHYKAGNMNHALTVTSSPFIAQLDADMITTPRFLRRLLADLLDDPRAAYIYCPQGFYNWGPMDLMDDQQLRMHLRLHCWFAHFRVGPNAGSGVMWRRAALDFIGGFRTESLGEDFQTSWAVVTKGYTSIYCREFMQTGLVPWTAQAWLTQRNRWCIGTVEQLIFMSAEVYKSPNVNLFQRYIMLSQLWVPNIALVAIHVLYVFTSVVICTVMALTDTFLFIKDCYALRMIGHLTVASYYVVMFYYMLPYIDMPSPWPWIMNVKQVAYEVEAQYAVWWVIRFFIGVKGGWKATGSVPTSFAETDKGWMAWFSKMAGELWFVWYRLFTWSVSMIMACFIMTEYWHCAHPFWWYARLFGPIAVAVSLPPILLPVWYYAHAMPKKSERRSMITYNKEGVPCMDPAAIWPKVHLPSLIIMSVPPIVCLAGATALSFVSVMYPPDYKGEKWFCSPIHQQRTWWS